MYLLFQVFSSSNKAWNLSKSSFNSGHCKLDLLMKNIKMENLILITFAGRAEHFTCVPVVQSILINNSSLHLEFIATVPVQHTLFIANHFFVCSIYRHNLPMQSRRMFQLPGNAYSLYMYPSYSNLLSTHNPNLTPTPQKINYSI